MRMSVMANPFQGVYAALAPGNLKAAVIKEFTRAVPDGGRVINQQNFDLRTIDRIGCRSRASFPGFFTRVVIRMCRNDSTSRGELQLI